ncbi:MAG TPA: PIG-L family deacetylase [Thermoanaerobaculia bacterium]|nr:PIG-L family deacetylase [Thermoanaerobaculia bacterium]
MRSPISITHNRAVALLGLAVALVVPGLARPESLEPPSTGGMIALHRLLSRLDAHRRVLVVGAHPDDEDTALLALVARGMGGEAAYLSLSRGEGGQNLIGPELGEELGLIRTQELLAARGVDGARQFFTRAFDFGYTRSLDETLEKWPKEAILEDTVRVVRRFKPQIIVSIFPTTADAGHGQHQEAGVVAHEVFTASVDAARFAAEEGLPPWRASALYRSTFFRPTADSLTLATGTIDPASGKTYFQLAMASRSMHRSQDMGVLQDTGPRATRVEWVAGVRPDTPAGEGAAATASGGGSGGNPFQQPGPGTQKATVPHGDLFAGVDTRLRAIADALDSGPERDALVSSLDRVSSDVTALRGELAASHLDAAVPRLREVVGLLEAASRRLASAPIAEEQRTVAGDLVAEKHELAREALAIAAGWVLDAYTEAPAITPGETVTVRATFYNGGSSAVRVAPALHSVERDWPAAAGEAREVAAGALESWEVAIRVPTAAKPSVPYFLASPRRGDLYDWSGVPSAVRGEPFAPPILTAAFDVESAGARIEVEREVVHRFRDQAVGERRRPLRVVPALELSVVPDRVLWPVGADGERTLRVTLRKHVAGAVSGRLELEPPAGGPATAPVPFALEASRDSRAYDLRLARGERATDDAVAAVRVSAVLDGGGVMTGAFPLIAYPHIQAVPSPHRSAVEVRSLELELPKLDAIGYVRGASDRVPESLLEVGVPLRLLSGEQILDLGEEGLDRFDAIVLGSRAYEADERLGEANQRLLDYVRGGGLLIVQYQQYDFVQRGYAPFPITIARPHDRITDEESPVEALAAESAVLRRPHAIGAADWEGWVQERGLYFARTWDPAYQPVLRMTDPELPPQDGGLLIAPLGKGTYVYTGLAFFRQLPAGVPGAFRLFVNLLALGS